MGDFSGGKTESTWAGRLGSELSINFPWQSRHQPRSNTCKWASTKSAIAKWRSRLSSQTSWITWSERSLQRRLGGTFRGRRLAGMFPWSRQTRERHSGHTAASPSTPRKRSLQGLDTAEAIHEKLACPQTPVIGTHPAVAFAGLAPGKGDGAEFQQETLARSQSGIEMCILPRTRMEAMDRGGWSMGSQGKGVDRRHFGLDAQPPSPEQLSRHPAPVSSFFDGRARENHVSNRVKAHSSLPVRRARLSRHEWTVGPSRHCDDPEDLNSQRAGHDWRLLSCFFTSAASL